MLHRKPVQLDQGRGGKKLRTLAIEYNRIVCRKLNKGNEHIKTDDKIYTYWNTICYSLGPELQ